MFDRFSGHSRKLMGDARQAALDWSHDYIGTEHILLGLLDSRGVAEDLLDAFEVDRHDVRRLVENRMTRGDQVITRQQLPFTPRAKVVLELALAEASKFRHNYVGSEHLLLGLLLEEEGIAAQALAESGLQVEPVRETIRELVGGPPPPTPLEELESLKRQLRSLQARVDELERRLEEE